MRYADYACSYTETHDPHTYVFTGECACCKSEQSVVIPGPELYAYRSGQLIQDAMPSVSLDEREFLISGTCPACWDKLFGNDDDEEFLESCMDPDILEPIDIDDTVDEDLQRRAEETFQQFKDDLTEEDF